MFYFSPTKKSIKVTICIMYYHSLIPVLKALALSVIPYNFNQDNKIVDNTPKSFLKIT
jgi:hypothetical protein